MSRCRSSRWWKTIHFDIIEDVTGIRRIVVSVVVNGLGIGIVDTPQQLIMGIGCRFVDERRHQGRTLDIRELIIGRRIVMGLGFGFAEGCVDETAIHCMVVVPVIIEMKVVNDRRRLEPTAHYTMRKWVDSVP